MYTCLEALDSDTDVVVTVTPASRSPHFNMVSRDGRGYSKLLIPSAGFSRRQDAPIVYDMTTVAYVLRPNFILQKKNIFDGKVKSVVVPKQRAVDIDDIYDFKMAEIILQEQE